MSKWQRAFGFWKAWMLFFLSEVSKWGCKKSKNFLSNIGLKRGTLSLASPRSEKL